MHTLKLLLIIQILPGIADRLRKTEERIDINIDRKITDNSALRGAGAARGAGIGAGIYKDPQEAFAGLKCTQTIEPLNNQKSTYQQAYQKWLEILNQQL